MSLLAVDLGTSGTRVAAFTTDGRLLAQAARPTTLSRPAPGIVETDAEQCLADVVSLLSQVSAAEAVATDRPDAISFSVQGEAVVPVDADGRALAPAPVSMDRRGGGAVARVVGGVGADLQDLTGQPVHPMFSVYKIAAGGPGWHGHDVAGYRCLGDFVAARLGARAAIDTTMAARTGALDVAARRWSSEVLDAVGIAEASLAEVVEPGTVVGALDAAAGTATGLPAGLPVVVGSHDQASSYWGGGGRPGVAAVFAFGSSDCLTVGTPQRPPRLAGTGLATYPVRDGWLTLAGTAAGGWALDWFSRIAGCTTDAERDALLGAATRTPGDELVLPYLVGSGTLDNDPSATGAVIGLRLTTTREDLARAFLEAAGYELRKIADALEERGVTVGEVWAVGTGAGASSLGLRADAAGRALLVGREGGSLRGAAMQAAVGVGIHPSFADVPPPVLARTASPSPEHAIHYATQASTYRALHGALARL